MLFNLVAKLVFCVFSSELIFAQSPAPAPAPNPAPTPAQIQAAQQQGTATGNQVGNQVSTIDQQGLGTQSTNYNTLEKSSADTMMNSQIGEATAVMMSGSLATTAAPYATSCDPNNLAGVEACAAGSVLTGMSGLMTNSSGTFTGPITQAWTNVCHFSTIGCTGPIIPNPFTPIVQNFPAPTPFVFQNLVKTFADKGFVINPKTGVVTTPDGKTIDPNNQKSIEGAVGAAGSKALQQILDKMQKDIANRLSKVKKNSYLQALGIGTGKDLGQKIVDALNGGSDTAKEAEARERSRRIRYNRLPEKEREKIEIAELMKSYNGTPIGVAAANIFKMVKKRYEIKASQKVFLLPELKVFKQTHNDELPIGR